MPSPTEASGEGHATVTRRISHFFISRDFALLWGGQAISDIGDFVYDTTLVLWIATRLAHGQPWAPLAVSGLFLARALPTVLVGPLAGVFVDRWDKRQTLLRMDLLRAALILLLVPLPLMSGHGLAPARQAALIYGVVILATICGQFFTPARRALLGDLVAEPERARASGLQQVTMNLAVIIGPPLATPLFFGLGVEWALIVNAASFVLSFLAVLAIRMPPVAARDDDGGPQAIMREFGAGLRFFRGEHVLMTLLITTVVVTLGGGAIDALNIFFVTRNLHAPTAFYGFLGAAQGVGAIVGAVLAGLFAGRVGVARTFWLSLLLAGVITLAYARMTSFLPAAILLCAIGVPVAALNVALGPLLLHVTPRAFVGRVTAVLVPAVNLALVVSIAAAGFLSSTVLRTLNVTILGVRWGPIDTIFAVSGVLVLAGGLYARANLRAVTLTTNSPTAPPPPVPHVDDPTHGAATPDAHPSRSLPER